ncbi:MAG: hypothetical protein A2Y73_04520 [Chloroflexi bacterium RBG_13_56_8]|nr:MAG: hypothetical protein A2Y73_04520 [Chloroflexi bacterium RBG_13_56_8]
MAGVLAFAAILRMGWPGVNSFSFDEARVSLLALQMVRLGEFARVGMQSSAGPPNFPAAVWIFSLPFAISSDPSVASLFVGFLGTLAVAGVWWMARQVWDPWAALSAALLLAGSPFAIFYARNIWGQSLLIPLAVAWAIAGFVAARQSRWWAVALHVFLGGFAFQVHYAGIALIPATFWLILQYRMWRNWPALLAGWVAAALCAMPFVYTAWCCDPSITEAFRQLWLEPAQADLVAFRQLLQMGLGLDWEWLLLGDAWSWPQPFSLLKNLSSILAAGLPLLGLIAWVRNLGKTGEEGEQSASPILFGLVIVWAFSAPLVFLRHTGPARIQYQLASLPALFLLGGAATRLFQRRWWEPTIVAVALLVAIAQGIAMGQGLTVVAQRLTPGGIGTPLMWPSAAARALRDGNPIVVHAYGDESEFYGDVAGFHVLFWDYPHRVVNGRSALLIPRREDPQYTVHLMATFPDLPAWIEAEECGLRGEVQLFPRREGEPPYVSLTITETTLSGFQSLPTVDLSNGARLRGWKVRQIEDRLRITTWWEIVGPLQAGQYHQFNHLRAEGSIDSLAIHDVPLSSQAWQMGDTLVSWVDFECPASPGPFWIEVGMYTWPEVERVPVINRAGDPLAPIRLGPFDLPATNRVSRLGVKRLPAL